MTKSQEIIEKYFKKLFIAGDRLYILGLWLKKSGGIIFLLSTILFTALFIYFIGFPRDESLNSGFSSLFRILFLILWCSKYIPALFTYERKTVVSMVFRTILFLFSTFLFLVGIHVFSPESVITTHFGNNIPLIITSFLLIISESSYVFEMITGKDISPSLVFAGSFLFIIFLGTGLLLLPNAHSTNLSFTDALFTSVSAVCVTGLTVVDTASSFTYLGKIIILFLIQAGGLGIMTFTGFFSYIFTSRSSLHERLLLRNIFSTKSLGNLFKILTKIILITFLTELAGTAIIYSSLDPEFRDKIFFSIFHSVSAFCNAGFSTMSSGLSEPAFNNNFTMKSAIAALIILGGIGFPVLLKSYSYIKNLFKAGMKKMKILSLQVTREEFGAGGRIILTTTAILLLGGMLLYYFTEKNGAYAGLGTGGKLFASFFDSVTARTAGFSIHNISGYGFPAITLTMFLMWIGASPGSTGGGIKTTTFAIAVRNAWSNIRGRDRLEISRREISSPTISRVLSIMVLSVLIIGAGFFMLLICEKEKEPVSLLFEAFSAFGTVGLSLAGTPSFSIQGKIVLIMLMFIGRIGPLTLFSGLLASRKKRYYTYPGSDIIIN